MTNSGKDSDAKSLAHGKLLAPEFHKGIERNTTEKPGLTGLFLYSYEGGDSEFLNYLVYTIKLKYVQNVFKLCKNYKND